MKRPPDLREMIAAFHGDLMRDPHHRYRSWEHCYQYFQSIKQDGIIAQRQDAALQLGFYLASWGMYRGSGFLLQHAYSVHLRVVDFLASPSLAALWQTDFGAIDDDDSVTQGILAAVDGVRTAYSEFGQATDTLVTKVLLGTLGCLPACDRYFINGFKRAGLKYSRVNSLFVTRVLRFCSENAAELRAMQTRIEAAGGVKYPFMKLIDMYFWQLGYKAKKDPP